MDSEQPKEHFPVVGLEEEMRRSYLDYAMSVIIGRAIPDIKDGLKPVHRRVLYAMYESGTFYNKPYKKSARIVGDVIGKYHPHGDQAAYDTLVRMAQDFSLRYVLVDGQGNFGSIDGDPPAAMRYTEVRLKKLAHELMADIDKETVNFIPNYDESLTMPEVLPSKFPNLLVNGGNGIAVGMATNIPPHNLTEVCDGVIHLIEHPNASLKDILKFVQGPDFPTGGIIYGRQGFLDAYKDGKGILHLRAKTDHRAGGQGREGQDRRHRDPLPGQQVAPPRVDRRARQRETDRGRRRHPRRVRPRGHADRHRGQARASSRRSSSTTSTSTPSSRSPSASSCWPSSTSSPRRSASIDMMKYFIAHRKEVILRRTRFELRKAEERAHILEGLVICLDNLDAIIKLIRASKKVDEARRGLMEKFGLTQLQAQAVLELQLQRLTQLERLKIQEEYAALKKRITELRKILKDERLVFAIIVQELKEVREEYGDERRTEIRDEAVSELRPEDLVKEEDVAVVYTSSGYIKRTSLTSYKFQARGGKGRRGIEMKAEDIVEDLYICSTHSYLLVFTNQGRLYWLKALDVPDVGVSGRGKPIANLVEFQPNEKPASVVAVKEFSENQFVVMLTSDGIIKKTRLSDFKNVRRGGILAVNLRPKSELFSAQLSTGKNNIVIGTKLGRALSFKESDVRPMGRTASGVRGIRLKPKDRVIGMIIVGPDEKFIFTASERGYGKKTAADMYPLKHRGGQGVLNLRITPKIGHALGMVGINEEDLLVITFEGKVIGIPTTQVRSSGRATQGVRIINLDGKDRVCSIAKVRES